MLKLQRIRSIPYSYTIKEAQTLRGFIYSIAKTHDTNSDFEMSAERFELKWYTEFIRRSDIKASYGVSFCLYTMFNDLLERIWEKRLTQRERFQVAWMSRDARWSIEGTEYNVEITVLRVLSSDKTD
jgi:hypothetical protein